MSNYFDHPLFGILASELPSGPREQFAHIVASKDTKALVQFPVNRRISVFASAHYPVNLSFEVFLHELFKKVSDLPLGIDTAAVAMHAFEDVEVLNRLQNTRMEKAEAFFNVDSRNRDKEPAETTLLFLRIRKQLEIILGKFPDRIEPRITTGATYDLKRGSTLLHRLANKPTITLNALEYLREIGEIQDLSCPYPYKPSLWTYKRHKDFSIVRGSRYGSVLKRWDTDRSCDYQPTINIAYQCGIGGQISKGLKSFGIDLSVAEQQHADMAAFASIDQKLATIDLVNASNTISKRCIEALFPSDWLKPMLALRTDHTWFPRTGVFKTLGWHRLEMMSANGNGFTFEMESALFLAISLASTGRVYNECPEGYSVYGDDIILPTNHALHAIQALRFYGFSVNTSKSYFGTEHFRESCGTDAFNGYVIRGINLKKLPSKPIHWFKFANSIRRCYYYNNASRWAHPAYARIWQKCIDELPKSLQLYGPRYLGDSVIHHEDEQMYRLKTRKWTGTHIKRLMLAVPDHLMVDWGNLINTLRSNSDDQMSAILHGSFAGYGYLFPQDVEYDPTNQYMPKKHIKQSFDDKDDWYRAQWAVYQACAGITVSDPEEAHDILLRASAARRSKLPLFLRLNKRSYLIYREELLLSQRRRLISILNRAILPIQEVESIEDDFDPSIFV